MHDESLMKQLNHQRCCVKSKWLYIYSVHRTESISWRLEREEDSRTVMRNEWVNQ